MAVIFAGLKSTQPSLSAGNNSHIRLLCEDYIFNTIDYSTKNISASFSHSSSISAIKQSWQTSLSPSLVCRNSSHPKSQTFQGTTFPFGNKYSLQYLSTWSPLKIVKKYYLKNLKNVFFAIFGQMIQKLILYEKFSDLFRIFFRPL